MDPVAHTLFGATLAEGGLKKKTAMATAALLIGANIPDVDAVAILWGSDAALHFRRGWTHGLPALLLWPFFLTGALLLAERALKRVGWRRSWAVISGSDVPVDDHRRLPDPPVRRGWLLAISFIAVWSHPLLDWLNTYGIRLLMPLDGTWFYGDTLFIIDPWVWLLTAAAVVTANSATRKGAIGWVVLGLATTALVTSTPSVPVVVKVLWFVSILLILWFRLKRNQPQRTRQMAVTCLMMLTLYILFMLTGSRLSVQQVQDHLAADQIEVREAMASPQPARLFIRNGVAASDTHYYLYEVNWFRPESFTLLADPMPIVEPDAVIQAALDSPEIRGFRNWMRFPHYQVEETETGWQVTIRDLRSVTPWQEGESFGMVVIDVDESAIGEAGGP